MSSLLCVYPPFCSPVSPPYSLTYLAGFLERNTEFLFDILDLNAILHNQHFKKEYETTNKLLENYDQETYAPHIHELDINIRAFAKEHNNKLRKHEHTDALDFCLNKILEKKPTTVLFSVVYNSQAFFTYALAEKLQEKGIEVIVGGPSVTPQLKKIALYLPHEVALVEHLTKKEQEMNSLDCRRINNFSTLKENYLTPSSVIPLKTSSCCYYQQCAFCTHHMKGNYSEYDLEDLKTSIIESKAKLVFFVDDMIHKNRLLAMAKMLKPLNVTWMCQLRPTKDLDKETLKTLYESGCLIILWGVESGNNEMLKKMRKGTNIKEVSEVLINTHAVGIKNVTYILFGFPGETKETFLDTINFLKEHDEVIDLISTTTFGLQVGAPTYEDPEHFGITSISKMKREMLPDKLSYKTTALHADDAKILRKKYMKTLLNINNYPKEMNMFREHMLYVVANLK